MAIIGHACITGHLPQGHTPATLDICTSSGITKELYPYRVITPPRYVPTAPWIGARDSRGIQSGVGYIASSIYTYIHEVNIGMSYKCSIISIVMKPQGFHVLKAYDFIITSSHLIKGTGTFCKN